MFKRMMLKRVLGAVRRLENGTKKRLLIGTCGIRKLCLFDPMKMSAFFGILLVCLSSLARTQAAVVYTTLLEFNFETANNHNSNNESYGVAYVSGISGNFVTTHRSGSAGIEGAGSGAGSSFNRYSGTSTTSTTGVPTAYFTLTAPRGFDAVNFDRLSNHNFSYTQPSYNVNVDLGTKSGGSYSWANAGTFLATSTSGAWTSSSISFTSLAGNLGAGDYAIRFVAQTSSTQSDFLGLDNVKIVSNVPEPSALSLLAVGLGGLAILRRRT